MNTKEKRVVFFTRKIEPVKSLNKGIWTNEQDKFIQECVFDLGIDQWSLITKKFNAEFPDNLKSRKSISERFKNQLFSNFKKTVFSEEEIEKVYKYRQLHGNKWSLIQQFLPGRTERDIKNFYYSGVRRKLRAIIKSIKKGTIYKNFKQNNRNKANFPILNLIYKKLRNKKYNFDNINKYDVLKILKENCKDKPENSFPYENQANSSQVSLINNFSNNTDFSKNFNDEDSQMTISEKSDFYKDKVFYDYDDVF